MSNPYLCPNCKTNRMRFNIIEQVAKSVKIDPQSGKLLEEFSSEISIPFHMSYKGPSYKIQCGSCGVIGEEISFIKHAQLNPR